MPCGSNKADIGLSLTEAGQIRTKIRSAVKSMPKRSNRLKSPNTQPKGYMRIYAPFTFVSNFRIVRSKGRF